MYEFKKNRSNFYMKIWDNNDCINISVNAMVKHLLDLIAKKFVASSPTGWKKSKNYQELYNLWIPRNRIDEDLLQYIIDWAEKANSYIWLTTNKNTKDFFCGNEIDFCLAADWNYVFETNKRTPIGEAEYQLKYQLPKGLLNIDDIKKYEKLIKNTLYSSIDSLHFDKHDFLVTTIPAVKENQNKLSWEIAKWISNKYDMEFLKGTLLSNKPQMKEQEVGNKIQIWRKIYKKPSNICLSCDVSGKNVLIVDDLYQSGASIWCYAEMLKSLGANIVVAVAAVKSLRDGDNT